MIGQRNLTLAQAAKLDKLPDATVVVGWNEHPVGPVVRHPNGTVRVVKPDGRLCVCKREARR